MNFQRLGYSVALAMTLVLGAAVLPQGTAEAQTSQVNAGIKGTIGLGLVGAELGFVIPAAAGLDDTWAFIVFPIIGGAGGAVAGYFLLDEPAAAGEGEISVIALAAGMGLAIPAMVLTLSLTAYDPGDDDEGGGEDAELAAEFDESAEESIGGDEGNPPAEPGPEARARTRSLASAGNGLLRLSERGLSLAVPAIAMRHAYSADEVHRYGVDQHDELHVPVVSGTF